MKRALKYILAILAVIPIIAAAYYLMTAPPHEAPESKDSPSLPQSPASPNVMRGIRLTKKSGNSTLNLNISTAKPYLPKPGNLLQFAMEKDGDYKLKLRMVKLRLENEGSFIELEAREGFSNEEFTDIKLKGLRSIGQKGFSLNPAARAVKLTVKDDRIELRQSQ